MTGGFIQFKKGGDNFFELIKRRPTAFVLLALVARRAKWNVNNFNDLEMGEALIGDFETYGATRRTYRTDLQYLTMYHFLTIKTTNKGTIAKIVDTSIFDINARSIGRQRDKQEANERPLTNKEKNKKYISKEEFISHRVAILGEFEQMGLFKTKDCLKVLKTFLRKITTSPKYMNKYKDFKDAYMNWLENSPDVYLGQEGELQRQMDLEKRRGDGWSFDY